MENNILIPILELISYLALVYIFLKTEDKINSHNSIHYSNTETLTNAIIELNKRLNFVEKELKVDQCPSKSMTLKLQKSDQLDH